VSRQATRSSGGENSVDLQSFQNALLAKPARGLGQYPCGISVYVRPGAASSAWIGVQHWNSTHYWLHASVQVPSWPLAGYTRISKLVRFEDAAREFMSCIDVLQAECSPARYVNAPMPRSGPCIVD
jgi:hypothetical protein